MPVPYAGDERTLLLYFLDKHRDALRRKTDGLDAAQLAARLAPSDLTLGGLLRHTAGVEDFWFGVNLAGLPTSAPFDDVDWDADEDWDFHSAADLEPDHLRAEHARFVARSDELIAAADLDDVCVRRHPDTGEGLSLRWVLLHMIEEYARHNGHADLVRESVDGAVGQ